VKQIEVRAAAHFVKLVVTRNSDYASRKKHIGETVDGFCHNFIGGSKKILYMLLSHFSLITRFNSVIYHTTLIVKIEKEKGCQFR